MMRKPFAILLLFLLALTQTELGQLAKVPRLVQHYSVHKQQKPALSLLDFLKKHYSKPHQDSDQAADDALPFKTAIPYQFLTFVLAPYAKAIQPYAPGHRHPYPLLNASPFLQQASHSIFHPPRAAVV